MAETGKKIIFEGQDNTSQAANTAKKNLTDLHQANIKGQSEVNRGLQQGNQLLKEQISLLEKQKQLITSIASQGLTPTQTGMVSQLTGKLFQSPDRVNPEHLKSYSDVLNKAGLSSDPKGLSERLIAKMQELIDTEKIHHKETMTHHLADDEKNRPGGTNFGSLIKSFDEKLKGKRYGEISGEELEAKQFAFTKQKEIRDLVAGKEEKKESPESEAVKKITEAAIKMGEHPIESLSERLTKGGGFLGGLAASVLALGTAEYQMYAKPLAEAKASATNVTQLGFARKHINPIDMEETLTGEGVGLAARERSFEEQQKLEAQQIRFRALTGRQSGIGDMSQFGLSSAEATEKAAEVSSNLGRSANNADVMSSLLTEALGINAGGLERLGRYSATEQKPDEFVASMLETLGMTGDRSKSPEWANELIKIGEQHLTVLGHIDNKQTLSTMAAFNSIGTPLFTNAETQGQIFNALDQGLTNPNSQFAKAAEFASISKIAPGSTFWETKKIMSQGLAGPKGGQLLDQTIQDLMQQFGGDKDNVKIAMLQRFPQLTPEEIDELIEKYTPGMFSKNMTVSGAKELTKLRGQTYANLSSRQKAQIESAFAISPEAGISMIDKLEGGGAAKGRDMSKATTEDKAQQAMENNSSALNSLTRQTEKLNNFLESHGPEKTAQILQSSTVPKQVVSLKTIRHQ